MDNDERMKQVDELLSDNARMSAFLQDASSCGLGDKNQRRILFCSKGITLCGWFAPTRSLLICAIDISSDGPVKNEDHGLYDVSFITVWHMGEWIKEGPWIEPIRALLAELIEKLELAKEEKARKEREEQEAAQATRQAQDDALIAAWS